jgi:hypothetical protein
VLRSTSTPDTGNNKISDEFLELFKDDDTGVKGGWMGWGGYMRMCISVEAGRTPKEEMIRVWGNDKISEDFLELFKDDDTGVKGG